MHRFWGLVFGLVLLGALVLTAVSPWQQWWLPIGTSSYSAEIDWLFYAILWTVTFFYVLTEAILVYNLLKFAGPNRKAPFVHGSHRLEMLWTVIPAVILILIAVVQIHVWADVKYPTRITEKINDKPQEYLQVEIAARQWEYRIRYPGPARIAEWEASKSAAQNDFAGRLPERYDDVHTVNDLHCWKGQNVLIYLKTRDVGHSIFLPNIRVKQDALPGKTIPVWFKPTEANTARMPGEDIWYDGQQERGQRRDRDGSMTISWTSDPKNYTFDMVCTQYCGTRHSMMRGKLYVHPTKEDFLDWLKHTQKETHSKTVATR